MTGRAVLGYTLAVADSAVARRSQRDGLDAMAHNQGAAEPMESNGFQWQQGEALNPPRHRRVPPRLRLHPRKHLMHRLSIALTALAGIVLAPMLSAGQTPPVPSVAAPAPGLVPPTVTAPTDASATVVPPAAAPLVPAAPTTVPMIAIMDVDREMTALTGDITQSHTRLQQITAMVLERTGGGARLLIDHENDMGSTFRLVRATYSLDGATIATRTDDNGSLSDQPSFSVYNGAVTSGDHNLTVSLEYQGNGYGIFSYIRGYTFRARSVQSFSVPEGRALRLVVVGYERGGATSAIEDRPAIRYTQTPMTLREAQTLTQQSNAPGTVGGPAAPTRTPSPQAGATAP